MKKILFVSLLVVLASCKKEDVVPQDTGPSTTEIGVAVDVTATTDIAPAATAVDGASTASDVAAPADVTADK